MKKESIHPIIPPSKRLSASLETYMTKHKDEPMGKEKKSKKTILKSKKVKGVDHNEEQDEFVKDVDANNK
jgi:hypothetical protein